MRTGDIENIKKDLIGIKFAILKIREHSSFINFPASFMIETLSVTDDNILVCNTSTTSIPRHITGKKNLKVKLNYIQKSKGMFIKVFGCVTLVNTMAFKLGEGKKNILHEEGVLQLKIKIEEAYYYKKRSSSLYTSFLQATNTFYFA